MTEVKRYSNSYIYKLYSHINKFYYIGSTHNTLRHRKNVHLSKNRVSQKLSDWIDDVGKENVKIMEVQHYQDITFHERLRYEDDEVKKHLEDEFCLNCRRVYLTEEERINKDKEYHSTEQWKIKKRELDKKYRDSHKEEAKEYKKQWHQDNKERLNKKSKDYAR